MAIVCKMRSLTFGEMVIGRNELFLSLYLFFEKFESRSGSQSRISHIKKPELYKKNAAENYRGVFFIFVFFYRLNNLISHPNKLGEDSSVWTLFSRDASWVCKAVTVSPISF